MTQTIDSEISTPRFRLAIETGNAAFEGNAAGEVARILRKLAARIEESGLHFYTSPPAPIFDNNGNRVGLALFTPEAGEAE